MKALEDRHGKDADKVDKKIEIRGKELELEHERAKTTEDPT